MLTLWYLERFSVRCDRCFGVRVATTVQIRKVQSAASSIFVQFSLFVSAATTNMDVFDAIRACLSTKAAPPSPPIPFEQSVLFYVLWLCGLILLIHTVTWLQSVLKVHPYHSLLSKQRRAEKLRSLKEIGVCTKKNVSASTFLRTERALAMIIGDTVLYRDGS